MRKIVLLLCLAIFTSCGTTLKTIPATEKNYSIDFTSYTEKGFLFTPEKYIGPYESIGLISFKATPKANYITTSAEDAYGSYKKQIWVSDSFSLLNVLPKVYNLCIEMGADALMNFKYDIITEEYKFIPNPTVIVGIQVTGFAIKRNEK